jgi:hypothetical protein
MKQQFNEQHLILYIFNELSILETAALEKALKEDAKLAGQLAQLREGQNQLKGLELFPDNSVVENILNYSKTSSYETEIH